MDHFGQGKQKELTWFFFLITLLSSKFPIPALKQISVWFKEILNCCETMCFLFNANLRGSRSISAASFQKIQLKTDSGLKSSSWTVENWQCYVSKNKALHWKVVGELNCRYCCQLHLFLSDLCLLLLKRIIPLKSNILSSALMACFWLLVLSCITWLPVPQQPMKGLIPAHPRSQGHTDSGSHIYNAKAWPGCSAFSGSQYVIS